MKIAIVDRGGFSRFMREKNTPWLDPAEHEVHLFTDLPKVASTPLCNVAAVYGYPIDEEAATGALLRAAASSLKFDAIVVYPENLQMCIAQVRQKLGLRGRGPDWVRQFRDKDVMKHVARRAGLECADSIPVESRDDVRSMLLRHGKIVVKPRDGAGSAGVHVLVSPEQVDLLPADLSNHQAEEFIDGEMIHVDAVVQDSAIVVTMVSRYLGTTLNHVSGLPLGSVVSDDPTLIAAAGSMLESVVAGFSIGDAVLHLEAFRAERGLIFNEVACRAGGGPIVETALAHTGYNLMGAMIDLEMGTPVAPVYQDRGGSHHGFVMFYAPPGVFDEVDASQVPSDWVVTSHVGPKRGEMVTPVGRAGGAIGYFLVRGVDEKEVSFRIEAMKTSVKVRMLAA